MCLNTYSPFPFAKRAKKPIICYKQLIEIDGRYYTPFQHSEIEIGKEFQSELIKEGLFSSNVVINVGLHSFMWYHETIKSPLTFAPKGRIVVVLCEIPIGSKYYKGRFNGNDSYASNKLKYLQIIRSLK